MSQSLAKVYIHLVFSTKNGVTTIKEQYRKELQAFKDELRLSFSEYGIDYDERYVWD